MAGIWQLSNYDHALADEIQSHLGVSGLTSALMVLRGIEDITQAASFLNAGLEALSDPFLMGGIEEAVVRINRAAELHEKVVIYGDYDADGVCSVVILMECLQEMGCAVDYYVPDRFTEGYGLNSDAISRLAEQDYRLLITVDCGISSVDEVQLAITRGLDIIITDHHTPPPIVPDALAVINPKIQSPSSAAPLAGAGVALKLASALVSGRGLQQQMMEWLALAALATVADMVPLREENRIIVKYGLQVMQDSQRIGLRALTEEVRLAGCPLKAWQLGFILGPRLNAAGRMDTARVSIDLLLSQKPDRARDLARRLEQMNTERRHIEEGIFQAAVEIISHLDLEREPVLVVGGEGWNVGVVGIVASRLVAKYNRPAIVVSWANGIGKASARSGDGFDLYMALDSIRDSLLGFGGHKMAAGLSLQYDKLEKVREGLKSFAVQTGFRWKDSYPYLIDLEIDEDEITADLIEELQHLEPFGEANPVPTFVVRGGIIRNPSRVGVNRAHLRMGLGSGNLIGIAFNRAEELDGILQYCTQDLLFELDENIYKGKKTTQLKVKDIKSTFQMDDRGGSGAAQRGFLGYIERAVTELAEQRPVVLVYPTYRSLIKYQAALDYWFHPGLIHPLHGHLWPEERNGQQETLTRGLGGIYLMTVSALEFYLARYQLPANMRFMAWLWPGESSDGWVNLPDHIETVVLESRHDYVFYPPTEPNGAPGRILVYANLPATVRRLNDQFPDLHIESGVSDMKQRINIRRKFWSERSGTLVSDGTRTVDWSTTRMFDRLILMDPPFGSYEVYSLAERMGESGQDRIAVAFDRTAFDANRHFLDRLYPQPDLIRRVWERFLRCAKPDGLFKLNETAMTIGNSLNISRLETTSALHILADLNLCRFQKRSSIMAINRGASGKCIDNSDTSLYWQEGRTERLVLADWEERLISGLDW